MITAEEIARFLGIGDSFYGTIDQPKAISDPSFNAKSIGWCSDTNIHLLEQLKKGYVLISAEGLARINFDTGELKLLVVAQPRLAFAKMLEAFFVTKKNFGTYAASAYIDESTVYDGTSVEIGRNVVIEEDCIIGKRVSIGHNSVIMRGTVIKDGVTIGSNCTIGGVGFGYEADQSGNYVVIPHIGNVVLHEKVEIGNNVCIDRAVMGSTTLHKNVKVDNLVHIAHGVEIGENSLIIAKAMIAGSVKIGKNVWVAPNVSIRQKLEIGDGSTIGMGSVVVKNVAPNTTVAGVPARPIQAK